MIQAQGYELSDMAQALCAAIILLVPLAAAGLALTNAGLGRSRSAAHAMLGSLSVVGVAALAYFVCGFAWQGFAGGPARAVTLAGKPWSWIGAEPFFLRGLRAGRLARGTGAWLQMFSVAIAALIPLGAGNDRWRLGAELRIHGAAGRLDLSAFCALGLGRRMAGATGRECRAGILALLDAGGSGTHSGGGRADRAVDRLDSGAAAGQVFAAAMPAAHSRPQRRAGPVRLFSALAGMDRD